MIKKHLLKFILGISGLFLVMGVGLTCFANDAVSNSLQSSYQTVSDSIFGGDHNQSDCRCTNISSTNGNFGNLTWTNATGTNTNLINVTWQNATGTNYNGTNITITQITSTYGNFPYLTWTYATGTFSYLPYVTSTAIYSNQVSTPILNVLGDATTTYHQYIGGGLTLGSGTPTTTANTIYNSGGNLYYGQNPISVFSTPLTNLYPITGISLVASTTAPTTTAAIQLQNKWLYMSGANTNATFNTYDVTDPLNPVLISTIPSSSASGVVSQGFKVINDTLYLVRNGTSPQQLAIFDISNRAAPVLMSTTSLPTNGSRIIISGDYAYITTGSSISTYDISSSTAPLFKSSVSTSAALGGMNIQNSYLYVAESGVFEIFSLATPSTPVFVASSTLGGLSGSGYAMPSGRYAYVTRNNPTNLLVKVDISNPTTPTVVATTTITTPGELQVQGKYIFIPSLTPGTLNIVDAETTSTVMTVLSTASGMTTPSALAVSAKYAYITGQTTPGKLFIVDLSGTEVSTLLAHNVEFGSGQVRGDWGIQKNLWIGTSLWVGKGGILSSGAISGSSLVIGGGTEITKHISATSSLDYSATAAGTCDTLTMTVTGAADGDTVVLGIPNALAASDNYQSFQGYVSAANTVTVKRCNLLNLVTALSNPAAAEVRADVWKH